MSRRLWLAVAAATCFSSACGGAAPLAPSDSAAGATLTGTTVSAIDGQAMAGVTVQIGLRKIVSDAAGAFRLENPPTGSQPIIFSAPTVIERHTTLVMPADGPVREELIPAAFDLDAFDQMFRSTGRLERWTSPPPLVVLTTVMTYAKDFGDGHQYRATSEQMTDVDVDLLVTQLTDALSLLTANTFTGFASVTREPAPAGKLVETVRQGQIVVGRYNGIQGMLNTIGFGRWVPDEEGQVIAGAVYLDADFDKNSEQRRLLRTHELGHALGYNHVTTRTSIMNPAIGPEATTFDRQGATIAFHRPPGNQSPDTDPTASSPHPSGGGLFTVSPITP